MRSLLIFAAALVATGLIACGSDDPTGTSDSGGQAEPAEIPGGADPEDVQVIDDWSQALSEGDLEGAADYFALPSVGQNGTPPLDLESREDVIAFNETLSCGAELVEATEHAGFIIASFELVERPGGECGPGVGLPARTAFKIEDGEIVQWRRAADEQSVEPPVEGPTV